MTSVPHSGAKSVTPGGSVTGHTPWTYEFVGESSDWVVFGAVSAADETGMTFQPAICTLSDSCDETEARLIAAAPDLLEALEAARTAIHQAYVDWDGEPEDVVPLQLARAKCDAAITRATGDRPEKGGAL